MIKPLSYSARRISHSALICLALTAVFMLPSPGWPCAGMFGPPSLAPVSAPAPGSTAKDGDPVDLSTGLGVIQKTDLVLPDLIPITLTRTYRQNDTQARNFGFGIGTNHPYNLILIGDQTNACTFADLLLPDGERIRYTRIQGTSCTNAVLEHTTTPTRFFKSILFLNNAMSWDIKLVDGTVYQFMDHIGQGTITNLSAIIDPNGNKLTVVYDLSRNALRITAPNGRWVDLLLNPNGRIDQAKDSIGRTVTYTYDTSNRLIEVTDPNGGITKYTYVSNDRMKTIEDAKGIVFLTNDYDAQGRVMKQTLADGAVYQFAYTTDANGKIIQTEVTDPRSNVRRVTFNSSGYTLSDTGAQGTSIQQTTTYTRQVGTNFIQSVLDPLARTTTYTYDSLGNVTQITRLPGQADEATTVFTYTPFNTLTYTPPSRVASITDPLGPGHTTSFTYDSKGNLTLVTNPFGKETKIFNNEKGQPLTITDPLGNITRFAYEAGDLVAVTDPQGNTTSRFVDAVGRLVSLTTPLKQTTRYEYDSLNRLKNVTDPLTGLTQFTYDPNGNLLKVTDARSGETEYQYNTMDRLEKRIDPLEREETYQYDLNGNLETFTDRNMQGTVFLYDALNRRTKATYHDSSTTMYTYDGGNRLTQVVDSQSGTITLGYDGLDRLTSESPPQGTVSYSYDKAGRRLTLSATGQEPASYVHDNANRLTSVSLYGLVAQYNYDDADRRTKLTLPNGVTIDYGYDQASRLTGLTYKLGASVLGDLTYTYDANGQRVKVGGSFARTNLPVPVSSATYDLANRVLTFDGFPATHDNNGNLTSLEGDTYSWDVRNRLASLTGSGLSASFQYDPLGRRIKKTFNGQPTEFMSDGVNPLQEQAVPGGNWTALTMTGLGVDEILARGDASGTYYFLPDGLGSTVALTDGVGAVHTEYTYAPFGETTRTGTVSTNPFQFTGRENDNTGLYYYRARYYQPVLQRFISKDPIGFGGGDTNLYAYTFNSPTNFTDPSGEIIPLLGACFGGAALNVTLDVGVNSLLGGKSSGGNSLSDLAWSAATGCASGLVGLGAAKVLGRLFPGVTSGITSLAARFGTSPERIALLEQVITPQGGIRTSTTVARQLAGERSFIPTQSILDVIGSGTRVADPQGVPGQFLFRASAAFKKSQGVLEVLVHEPSGEIRHVLFRSLP